TPSLLSPSSTFDAGAPLNGGPHPREGIGQQFYRRALSRSRRGNPLFAGLFYTVGGGSSRGCERCQIIPIAPAMTSRIASAPRISRGSGKGCGSPGVMSASAPEMPPFFFGVVLGGFATITIAVVVVVVPFVVVVSVVVVVCDGVWLGEVVGPPFSGGADCLFRAPWRAATLSSFPLPSLSLPPRT